MSIKKSGLPREKYLTQHKVLAQQPVGPELDVEKIRYSLEEIHSKTQYLLNKVININLLEDSVCGSSEMKEPNNFVDSTLIKLSHIYEDLVILTKHLDKFI